MSSSQVPGDKRKIEDSEPELEGMDCEECDINFESLDDKYLHGYSHFQLEGLYNFVMKFRHHILSPFKLNQYNLGDGRVYKRKTVSSYEDGMLCRSFNIPLTPLQQLTPEFIASQLLRIRADVRRAFKFKVGVSRVLQLRSAGEKPIFKFFRTSHDALLEKELNGKDGVSKRSLVNVNMEVMDRDLMKPLHPFLVTDDQSVKELGPIIIDNINENLINDRDDSKWMVVSPTNLRIYIYMLDLGGGHHHGFKGFDWPQQMTQMKGYIVDAPPEQEDDNLCLFRCIVYHFMKGKGDDIQQRVQLMNHYFMQRKVGCKLFEADTQLPQVPDAAKKRKTGITLSELDLVEKLFNLHINVYRLVKGEKIYITQVLRLSQRMSKQCINLLFAYGSDLVPLCKGKKKREEKMGHFFYVSDVSRLLKKFQCPSCLQILKHKHNLVKHKESCGKSNMMYPGGFVKLMSSINQQLAVVGITLPPNLCYFTSFIAYDFESLMENKRYKTSKTEFTAIHHPCSFVLASSDDQQVAKCDPDPQSLVRSFLLELLKMRQGIVRRLVEQWEPVLEPLNKLIADAYVEKPEKAEGEQDPEEKLQYMRKQWEFQWHKHLLSLKLRIVKYLQEIPVFGYNSAKYDLGLIKKQLFAVILSEEKTKGLLDEIEGERESNYPDNFEPLPNVPYPEYEPSPECMNSLEIIKQANSYTKFTIKDRLIFLDIYKFQAPRTNLKTFMEMYGIPKSDGKGEFCYDYLTRKTLYSEKIPPVDAFFNKLKGNHLLGNSPEEIQRNYKEKVVDVWEREGMTNLSHFLLYYNQSNLRSREILCK